MEICFVPDNDYGGFLEKSGLAERHRGEIVDLQGRVLGHHEGIEFYTIGQRKGLGLSAPNPLYVLELNAEENRVVVGPVENLESDTFEVERCNWIAFEDLTESIEATTRIRYNHSGTMATVEPGANGCASIKLHTPQRAIAPGQACVFYQDDLVVGGGWIGR
jgi:tRNA-specific 2-thiouridylase